MKEILILDIICLILCPVSYEGGEVESSLRIQNGLKTQLKISNMGEMGKNRNATCRGPNAGLWNKAKTSIASGLSVGACEDGVSSVWMVEWAGWCGVWCGVTSVRGTATPPPPQLGQSLIRSLHSNNSNSNPLTDNTAHLCNIQPCHFKRGNSP